jgi:hypothetical protein
MQPPTVLGNGCRQAIGAEMTTDLQNELASAKAQAAASHEQEQVVGNTISFIDAFCPAGIKVPHGGFLIIARAQCIAGAVRVVLQHEARVERGVPHRRERVPADRRG